MAVDLSKAKIGDAFKTQNGEIVKYWYKEGFAANFNHRLRSIKNKEESYWYNKNGVCEGEIEEMNLVEKVEVHILEELEKKIKEKEPQPQTLPTQQTPSPKPSVSESAISTWGKGTRVIAIIELVAAVIVFFFFTFGYDGYEGIIIAFSVLAYGIIQLFPMMAIAKACDNSVEILNELKKHNNAKGGN